MCKSVFILSTSLHIFLLSSSGLAMSEEVGDIYGGLSYSQTIAKDTSANSLGPYKPMTLGIA